MEKNKMGKEMSEEYKRKLSEAHKQQPIEIKKLDKLHKGKHISEETKQKLSQARRSKQVTEICPYCGGVGVNCENLMIPEMRDATVLLVCDNDHLFGRAT